MSNKDEAVVTALRDKPKVSVRWEEAPKGYTHGHKMWVGRCAGCDYTTQYWAWGATLGRMLQHQWVGCKS